MKKLLARILRMILKGTPKIDAFPSGKDIFINPSVVIGQYRNLQIKEDACLRIEDNVSFREFCNILIYSNAHLVIHPNVFFNNYCSINCLGKIEIGENTLFGEAVKLYDHNHLHGFSPDQLLKIDRDNFKIGHILIGKNCWIGSNVTILNNVEIGDNVIIGANCLIHKSIPSNTIVKLRQELSVETKTSKN